MIETEEYSFNMDTLKDIAEFNLDRTKVEMENKSILNHVKEQLDKQQGGFIDIMRLYTSE